eukprot:394312_1
MSTCSSILTVTFIIYGLADQPDSYYDSLADSFDDTTTTNTPQNPIPDMNGLDTLMAIGSYLSFDEFRNINGTGNNIDDIKMGSTHTPTSRCIPAAYQDGYNSASSYNKYNPRELSNVLSTQNPEESEEWVNNRFLTQFAWQFGQFIDHDITLITEDKSTMDYASKMDIYMPCGDPTFDPDDECNADHIMEMFRSQAYNNSGSDHYNIRYQQNDITSWIDASMIYGSNPETADLLRQFKNGLLKITESEHGDLLPTDDDGNFLAGDIRVNEVTGLTMMHTIFVRLHNIIAMNIINKTIQSYPLIDDDDIDELIYQYAKLIVNAIIQKIVYKDWLPVLFGPTAINDFLGDYEGYNSSVDGDICNIFATAAFRFGHSMVPQKIPLRSDNCNACCGVTDLELKDAFFDPDLWMEQDDLMELLINGYSCTLANEVDLKITDGLRNFLFSNVQEPLDLMALNIQRGRDHGLPDYNHVRSVLGWSSMSYFTEMTSDEIMNHKMTILYKYDVDNVDLLVGLLAEQHLDDGSFGILTSQIVLQQFKRLREADRFWYENYIDEGELRDWIEDISLRDVIIATTKFTELETLDDDGDVFQNTKAVSIFNGYSEQSIKTVIDIYAGDKPENRVMYE